jgi:hypothetical protein
MAESIQEWIDTVSDEDNHVIRVVITEEKKEVYIDDDLVGTYLVGDE